MRKNKTAEAQIRLNIKMWKLGDVSQEEAKALSQKQNPNWEEHNLIVTVGLNVLARLLAGDATYSGEINYGAVGTGVAPVPALGDVALDTEEFRKLQSSQSASGTVSYIDFFYSAGDFDTDVIGAITEFGNFIDGGAGADSGQLFSYIATGGWTKTSTESLFVSCEYTLANA